MAKDKVISALASAVKLAEYMPVEEVIVLALVKTEQGMKLWAASSEMGYSQYQSMLRTARCKFTTADDPIQKEWEKING